ncbi:MAG: hypothetical protein ACRCYU_01630 [Nocardioides sp.]
MNAHNVAVAADLLVAIAEFEAVAYTLDEVQAVLESASDRFEKDGSGVADVVRRTESDLEEIRFTTLLDEQLPAAIFRLDALRADMEGMSHRRLDTLE